MIQKKQFKFEDFLNKCDTIVMGKKSYDMLSDEVLSSFSADKIYVVTHSKKKPIRQDVEFISGDIISFVKGLKQEDGKDIWLFGGAELTNQLVKAKLIDEYVIGIIPIILGKGKRLFSDDNPMSELKMKECTVTEGIAMLSYENRKLI